MKSLLKFAIALLYFLLRSILRHITSLLPSLNATTTSPPVTASASDSAQAVDYTRVISASIVMYIG